MENRRVLIVTTGYASVESAVHALNEGTAAYLTKPMHGAEVPLTIGRILAQQETRPAQPQSPGPADRRQRIGSDRRGTQA